MHEIRAQIRTGSLQYSYPFSNSRSCVGRSHFAEQRLLTQDEPGRTALLVHKKRKAVVCPTSAGDLASLDDRSLAADLASGRHEALSVLFKRYEGLVFRRARRILGDSGEAEEVTLQVFLEMHEHISEFDPGKGSFISWLLRRTKFRALNRKDRLNSERFYDWTELDETIEAEIESHRNDTVYRQEIEPLLDELLSKLPYRKRRVVSLTFFEGRTAPEISELTDESVHVVRHLLTEALNELRSSAQKRIWKKQGKRN